VSTPELSVVCRSCGSEVSPYVTECPYCGARLRRRAPKLEREGDELRVRESLRARRRRILRERRAKRERRRIARPRIAALAASRPYATISAIVASAAMAVVERAGGYYPEQLGAIFHPADSGAWRYLAAPFVYQHLGYLFAVGLALAIFGPGIERRIGLPLTAVLLVACGALGYVAAVGIDDALGDGILYAAGGNAVALGAIGCWTMLRRAEVVRDPVGSLDQVAVVVSASVILLLPIFEDLASPWAGVVGGAVGLLAGAVAARLGMADS
jgi:membrane associated rhomboid family serine protease